MILFSLYKKSVVGFLLNSLRVGNTSLYLQEVCRFNPDILQSIQGISKILSLYRVEQNAVWIEEKDDFIHKYDSSFVAQTSDGTILVAKKEGHSVSAFDGKSQTFYSIEQFINRWTGLALLVEKNRNSGEPQYKQNVINYWLRLLIEAGCILSFLFLIVTFAIKSAEGDIFIIVSLLINSIGIVVCSLLLGKQLNAISSFAHKVCTAFSKQDGCHTVLNTRAAKIGGIVSWSEIGFGFFLTNCIWILIAPIVYPYVLLINILSLLFSFWSIGYQMFVAR